MTSSPSKTGTRVAICSQRGVESLHLRRSLTRGHLSVVGETNTGRELVEIVSRERPDVVVVDAHLPDTPVQDLARLILAAHPAALILLTDLPGYDEQAAKMGASACLERPYNADDLIASLQQALTRRST